MNSPLVTFFVPFRSKQTTNDWGLVCNLLQNTLQSIFGQTSPSFEVVVICHEKPDMACSFDDRLRYLEVDLPVPSKDLGVSTMDDKWMKLASGLISVRAQPSPYSMFVDADDLVNRNLVAFVGQDRNPNGYIIKQGYWYTCGDRWMLYKRNFNCGTNSVLRLDSLHLPVSLDSASRMSCIALRSGHMKIEANMIAEDRPLAHLPFPGAVYVQHSQQWTQMTSSLGERRKTIRNRLGDVKRFCQIAHQYRFFGKQLRNNFSVSPQDYC